MVSDSRGHPYRIVPLRSVRESTVADVAKQNRFTSKAPQLTLRNEPGKRRIIEPRLMRPVCWSGCCASTVSNELPGCFRPLPNGGSFSRVIQSLNAQQASGQES